MPTLAFDLAGMSSVSGTIQSASRKLTRAITMPPATRTQHAPQGNPGSLHRNQFAVAGHRPQAEHAADQHGKRQELDDRAGYNKREVFQHLPDSVITIAEIIEFTDKGKEQRKAYQQQQGSQRAQVNTCAGYSD